MRVDYAFRQKLSTHRISYLMKYIGGVKNGDQSHSKLL